MYRFLLSISLMAFWHLTGFGQFTPAEYWPMETDAKIKEILRSPTMIPEKHPGLFDQAIYLNGKSTSLHLSSFLKMEEAITISFWFKPDQYYGEQALLHQSRTATAAPNEVGRFIEVYLNDNFGKTRTEKSTLTDQLTNLNVLAKETDGWLFFTFTGDEYGYQIYIQGQEVAQSNDGTMFRKLGNHTNDLVLGRGKGQFIGQIDELKIFEEHFDAYMVQSLWKTDRKRLKVLASSQSPKPGGDLVEKTAELPIPPEEEKKKELEILKERKIDLYEQSVQVNTDGIRLRIWDSYRRIDNDRISIYLNGEAQEIRKGLVLKKKRRYDEIYIKLADQEENILVFYADDMGDYYSSASIALQVVGEEEVFKLTANRKSNAALKIVREKQALAKLETLSGVKTQEKMVQLEFAKSRNSDANQTVAIRVEIEGEDKVTVLSLEEEKQTLDLQFDPNETKKISIRRDQDWAREGEHNIVRMIVKDADGELKRMPLFLHKKYYEMAIQQQTKIEVVDNGQRQIKIPKAVSQITLEISDHDQPDADKISIVYNNLPVASEQELLTTPTTLKVDLNPGLLKHSLYISTDSYGTSPEPISTPRIRVFAGGKELDNFVFRLRKTSNNGTAVLDLWVEE